LCDLLAGVLIRECTANYSLELSKISSEDLKLIISNIIIKDNVDWNTTKWNKLRLWFNKNNFHMGGCVERNKLQSLLRNK